MNLLACRDRRSGRARPREPEPITTGVPFLRHPAISADGRRIAYTAKVETEEHSEGSHSTRHGTVEGDPAWVTARYAGLGKPDPAPDGESVVGIFRCPAVRG